MSPKKSKRGGSDQGFERLVHIMVDTKSKAVIVNCKDASKGRAEAAVIKASEKQQHSFANNKHIPFLLSARLIEALLI